MGSLDGLDMYLRIKMESQSVFQAKTEVKIFLLNCVPVLHLNVPSE